ncbi:YbhB/YbcL family Raf kinase inhibitor-like protein [Candidatus Wolfebacteria bacterium]|nr:MAG: YbhB/YbcL family Raf kinase inhibitor-like protein [Candidatus Wolfebacteria bacterium]
MKIESSAFAHNKSIPSLYTCDGDNINPELSFINVPENSKSLVLLMEDPDVPTSIRADGIWDHWVVFNIPAETTGMLENAKPAGTEGISSGGNIGYEGPCPPDREHRYSFKLFALSSKLGLEEGATKDQVLEAMQTHVIESAELIGRYNRI